MSEPVEPQEQARRRAELIALLEADRGSSWGRGRTVLALLLLAAVTAGMLAASVSYLTRTSVLGARGVDTTATVLRTIVNRRSVDTVVVTYEVDGRSYQEGIDDENRDIAVGDRVVVTYDPADPETVFLDRAGNSQRTRGIGLLVTALLLNGAVYGYYRLGRWTDSQQDARLARLRAGGPLSLPLD